MSKMIFIVLWTGTRSFVVLPDLSAAFDIVDHGILLHRIHTGLGIGGTALNIEYYFYMDDTQLYISFDLIN